MGGEGDVGRCHYAAHFRFPIAGLSFGVATRGSLRHSEALLSGSLGVPPVRGALQANSGNKLGSDEISRVTRRIRKKCL